MSDPIETTEGSLDDRLVEVYVAIWNTKTKLNWTTGNCPFYEYLTTIEKDSSQLQLDVFRLVGFYVGFGSIIYYYIDSISKRISDYSLKFLIQKYRIEDDPKVTNPLISISEMVAYFPFYVAEHLHVGGGHIFGSIYDLPRCLAFQGGLRLIPENVQWDNLLIAWKIWRARIDPDEIRSLKYKSYIHVEYRTLIERNKHLLMDLFKIMEPSVGEVMKTIHSLVGSTLSADASDDEIVKCFKGIFPVHTKDILDFYQKNKGHELKRKSDSTLSVKRKRLG